jgi:hypothetical protein
MANPAISNRVATRREDDNLLAFCDRIEVMKLPGSGCIQPFYP